ncbi:peptidoglycan recognition protein 3-like [Macrosteles quadrilineatus]|uniref:peptidoglycan recognition protein 3-like n=1 Tax=Macrosteles quadrilineatus TaxID=74068 RepID=UPI0023E2E4DB|nr:peptidoglycan recognition protein 3-like [Macrosteles quadrilineatus]
MKPSSYVDRYTWDAVDPLAVTTLDHPVTDVYVTAVEGQTYLRNVFYVQDCIRFLRELQKKDIYDEGLADIAYNFYVGGDGHVYEGRGWQVAPTLQHEGESHDVDGLAIAYIRPIPGSQPNELMVSKVKEVIQEGIQNGYIDENCNIEGLTHELESAG